MGLRINQNIAAMNAYRNLSVTDSQMSKSLEKLSSGFRINRAADDAAGLSISEGLRAQIGGLKQAVRNAQDGVNVVQTADGALTEVHSILQRMRDLAVQASNSGSQDATARDAAQKEFTALKSEIDRIGDTTSFGGQKLLNGSYGVQAASVTGFDPDNKITSAAGDDFTININATGAVTVDLAALTNVTGAQFASHVESQIKAALTAGNAAQQALADKVHVSAEQVGDGSSLTISVDLPNGQTFTLADGTGTPLAELGLAGATVNAASGSGGRFQIGANNEAAAQIDVNIAKVSANGLSIDTVDLVNDPTSAIDSINAAITSVSSTRADLGALQNRFEHTINNINVAVQNLSASESQIRDTDMASEMTQFTRAQILSQAGTAMLAQANSAPQGVLQLLRG